MYLKRLEIVGFKSFAKRTVLDFSSPITAVVGPNGSGKSNAAEALRWVLGEQSLKSVRAKRGEDFIWNGSKETARLNHASVTVVFDNSERKFNYDFEEVSIARHVYRDGSNEYFVNNTQVRLKDIYELLGSVGIGATSHHIISQGEADRVLSASPAERREMLEDALGLKVYLFKRSESEKKLEKTEENLRDARSLRREIAPHLKFLKKQVERLEQCEKIRNELRSLSTDYCAREEVDIDLSDKELSREAAPAEAEYAKIVAYIAETEERHKTDNAVILDAERRKELSEAERDLYNARIDRQECERIVGRIEGKLEAMPRSFLVSKNVCETCGQTINAVAKDRAEEQEARRNDLMEEKQKAEHGLREAVARESVLSAAVEKLREDAEESREKIRESERRLLSERARRSELQTLVQDFNRRREEIDARKEDLRKECAEAVRFLGDSFAQNVRIRIEDIGDTKFESSEKAELKRRIERLKVKMEDMAGDSGEVLKEYEEVSQRDAFLEKEIADLEHSAKSLHEMISDLTQKLHDEFMTGCAKISKEFNTFFGLMFDGGGASLDEVKIEKRRRNEEDTDEGETEVQETGVDIVVNLPRKKVRGLEMLSGGERALTSIALLFAMSRVNPPPFMVLDETDAALDESNSRRYGDMLERLAETTQLVLVTHNRETMSRAGILYGVTMSADGCSRLLSVKFDDAAAYAK